MRLTHVALDPPRPGSPIAPTPGVAAYARRGGQWVLIEHVSPHDVFKRELDWSYRFCGPNKRRSPAAFALALGEDIAAAEESLMAKYG